MCLQNVRDDVKLGQLYDSYIERQRLRYQDDDKNLPTIGFVSKVDAVNAMSSNYSNGSP